MGLDAPVFTQYVRFIGGLARGDLGNSLLRGQPVSDLISQRFWPTLQLAVSAMFVAAIAGIGLGVAAAFGSHLSTLARISISLSISTPIYWTGTMAIVLF